MFSWFVKTKKPDEIIIDKMDFGKYWNQFTIKDRYFSGFRLTLVIRGKKSYIIIHKDELSVILMDLYEFVDSFREISSHDFTMKTVCYDDEGYLDINFVFKRFTSSLLL